MGGVGIWWFEGGKGRCGGLAGGRSFYVLEDRGR